MTAVDARQRAEQLEGTVERRFVTLDEFELRKAGANTVHFTGYASLFDVPYEMLGGPDGGGWTEIVDRVAFNRTLSRSPDVVFNLNHGAAGSGLPMARTTAGNLTLAADNVGLLADAPDLSLDDPDVRMLKVKKDAGLLDQMSFVFRTIKHDWNHDTEERRLLELDLNHGDVSIVTNGAQPKTSSELRALLARLEQRVDPDEDPGVVAQAIDAALDAAQEAFAAGETDQGVALVSAAEISVDALLALLGVIDADDRSLARSLAERDPSTRMTVAQARRAVLLDA